MGVVNWWWCACSSLFALACACKGRVGYLSSQVKALFFGLAYDDESVEAAHCLEFNGPGRLGSAQEAAHGVKARPFGMARVHLV